MPHNENFVCFSYSTVEFLIPKKDVCTAFFCNASDFTADASGKIINKVSSNVSQYFDFDSFAKNLGQDLRPTEVKNCVVVQIQKTKKTAEAIGLVTTSDCRVKDISLNNFSLFSDLYGKNLNQKGIVACSFTKDSDIEKISYLIDIKKLLDATLEFYK